MKLKILSPLFLFFFLASHMLLSKNYTIPKTLKIGEYAPFFSLKGVDDKEYSLLDFAKKDILVIAFLSNHCPTSQAYVERVKIFVNHYKGKSLAFVAISPSDPEALRPDELKHSFVGDSFEEMKVYAKKYKLNFPYLYDGKNQVVSSLFGPKATPHFFVFDKERKLQYQGSFDNDLKAKNIKNNYLYNAINFLLSQKKTQIQKTRVFGCSTKWSFKKALVLNYKKSFLKKPVFVNKITLSEVQKFLANKQGNSVKFINFWASWCGSCIAELPTLATIMQTYTQKKFEFITISLDELKNKKIVLDILQSQGISLQGKAKKIALKEKRNTNNFIFVGQHENLWKFVPKWEGITPFSLIIAPGGKILYSKSGVVDLNEIRKVIFNYYGPLYKIPSKNL